MSPFFLHQESNNHNLPTMFYPVPSPPTDTTHSLKFHQAARAMGLESDSEDENFNTNRRRKYREKGRYDPPMDLSTPFGSPFTETRHMTHNNATATSDPSLESRSGTTISYGATDGYQRAIWQDRGAQESGQENNFIQASPRVTGSLRNSEYPSTDLGRSGDPWDEEILTHSTPGAYIKSHRRARNLRVDHPEGSDKIPVDLSTLIYSPHDGSPRNRLAENHRSSDKIPVESPTEAYSPRDRTSSRGVADAYQGNQRRSTDQQGFSPAHQLPPTPRPIFDPVRDAAARNLAAFTSRAHAEFPPHATSYALPFRPSISSAARTQAQTKGNSKATAETTSNKTDQAKTHRQKDEQEARERRGGNLQNSQHAFQKPGPSQPSAPIRIPLLPAPSTTPFQPNNSWPGNRNSPPYPRSRSITRPHRSPPSSLPSTAQLHHPPTTDPLPYPTTPPTYRLNAWTPHNSIQKHAIHHAFRDTLLNGHPRMAGPSPPTFRREFAGAQELDGRELRRGNEARRIARIAVPAGERRWGVELEAESASRGFSVRGSEAGDGRGGVPEIRVQNPTPNLSLSLREREGDVEGELEVPGRERERERGRRKKRHGHGHEHGHGHTHARRKSADASERRKSGEGHEHGVHRKK